MKTTLPLILFSLLLSCAEENADLDNCLRSKAAWEKLKATHGNSYRYQVKVQSWTGNGHTTDFIVTNDVVTSRMYESYRITETGLKEVIATYTEDSSQLGNHEEGSRVATIDDLYLICTQNLKVSESTNRRIFTTDDEGIVESCGYVPSGCVDDCFRGFRITLLEWL